LTDANTLDEGFEGEVKYKHGEATYKVNTLAPLRESDPEVVSLSFSLMSSPHVRFV
jgi:hypothetical protein